MERKVAVVLCSQLNEALSLIRWEPIAKVSADPASVFGSWIEKAKELALFITDTEAVRWEGAVLMPTPALTDKEAIRAHANRLQSYCEYFMRLCEGYFDLTPRTKWAEDAAKAIGGLTAIVGIRTHYDLACELWRMKVQAESGSGQGIPLPTINVAEVMREIDDRTRAILAILNKWEEERRRP